MTEQTKAVTSQELEELKYFDSGCLRSDFPKRKSAPNNDAPKKKKAKKNLPLEIPTIQGSTLKKVEPELRGLSCCPDFSGAGDDFDPDEFLKAIPKPVKEQAKLKIQKRQCPRCLVDMKFGVVQRKDGTKFKYYRCPVT